MVYLIDIHVQLGFQGNATLLERKAYLSNIITQMIMENPLQRFAKNKSLFLNYFLQVHTIVKGLTQCDGRFANVTEEESMNLQKMQFRKIQKSPLNLRLQCLKVGSFFEGQSKLVLLTFCQSSVQKLF